MWVVSKNRQKVVNAVAVKVENGNDITVEAPGGARLQMGNYASIDDCLQIIEDFVKAIETNPNGVYYLPKSKKEDSILRGL